MAFAASRSAVPVALVTSVAIILKKAVESLILLCPPDIVLQS
jgi:hypothetical protein